MVTKPTQTEVKIVTDTVRSAVAVLLPRFGIET